MTTPDPALEARAPRPHASPTRQDKKRMTREALREAAVACFARKGFLATSIADITLEARVAKGTFYVHYADKETLLDELLVEFNAALAERLRAVVLDGTDAPLESLVRAVARLVLDHWKAHAAFVRAYAERSSAGLDVTALPFGINPPVRDLLITALEVRSGGRLAGDPELLVHGLLAMWLRLGLQTIFRTDVRTDDVVETLVVLTTGALERAFSGPTGERANALPWDGTKGEGGERR